MRLLCAQLDDFNADQQVEFCVAGSWRRGADPVGDIDIIVINEAGTLEPTLIEPGVKLPTCVEWQRLGPKVANGDMQMEDGGVLHVDVWSCKPNERGAYLMFSTGPAQLNVWQRGLAVRKGMALSQVGLLDRNTKRQLDDGTERDIYRLLGLDYLTPEQRQKWADR